MGLGCGDWRGVVEGEAGVGEEVGMVMGVGFRGLGDAGGAVWGNEGGSRMVVDVVVVVGEVWEEDEGEEVGDGRGGGG